MHPITMFSRAAGRSAALARTVTDEQRTLPTPCSEWDVAALLEHVAGGTAYLLGALGLDASASGRWPDATVVDEVISALSTPGTLERRCMSPAGFEWSIGEATAGTAMDQLVHTWDLATALGTEPALDADVIDAIVAMFLPQMPEIGRQAGFIGPEVAVAADASALDRLLGAMGRNPAR